MTTIRSLTRHILWEAGFACLKWVAIMLFINFLSRPKQYSISYGPLAPSQVDDVVYVCDDVLVFSIALLPRISFCQRSVNP